MNEEQIKINVTHHTVGGTPEEKARQLGVPIIPPLPPGQPTRPDPNPTVAVCGECGLEVKQMMLYCCQNSRCPCRVHVTM